MSETAEQFAITAPPKYLQDFFAGDQEAGIAGILPLLNQELANRFLTMGTPGATPFTYRGDRIADFTPAQLEAFRLAAEGSGSYMPFFDSAENLYNQGIVSGASGIEEAQNLLRAIPDLTTASIVEGQDAARTGLDTLRSAADVAGGASGRFSIDDALEFTNPYLEETIDKTLEDIGEQFSTADIANRARAVGSGAFGGSRARLSSEELAEKFGEGATDRIAALRSGAFDRATQLAQGAFENEQRRRLGEAQLLSGIGRFESDIGARLGTLGTNLGATLGNVAGGIGSLGGSLADTLFSGAGNLSNLGTGMYNLIGTDINRLGTVGALQQAQDQRGLDLDFSNFVGQYNLPLETIGQIGQIGAGFAPALGSQTQATTTSEGGGSNPLMQGLGTLIAGYGMLNNPYANMTNQAQNITNMGVTRPAVPNTGTSQTIDDRYFQMG